MTREARAAAPPPPHDPYERVVVARLGAWEVRQFASDDAKTAYFPARGFLHVQLWHPDAGVSILTPSRLTRGMYEIVDADGVRVGVRHWRDVAGIVRAAVPGAAEVAAIERWMILRHEPGEMRLLRAWWSAGVPGRTRNGA